MLTPFSFFILLNRKGGNRNDVIHFVAACSRAALYSNQNGWQLGMPG